jgi:hypothetical protein
MKRSTLMLAALALWAFSSPAFAGPISGTVFNDLNGSGVILPSNPGLPGFTVDVLDSSNNLIATTTTDTSGSYGFVLDPGTYTVQEVLQAGWIQTFPAPPGTYTATVGSGSLSNLDFGNFQLVNVSGTVYNDLSDNGHLNPGEPGLPGWTVNLFDPVGDIIATTTTDASGSYSFVNLGPGTYTVQEVLQAGWNLTQPTPPGVYSFTASSGTNLTGADFGNFQGSAVPEPVSLSLLGIGSLSLLGYGWRRRKQAVA